MLYLTFNDPPSGIYSSQVIDVVLFFRKKFNTRIRLMAFISIRNFFSDRKKIKREVKDAVVIPMFPGLNNWRMNKWTLFAYCFFFKPGSIISRGVFAASLALDAKEKKVIHKVCYDGRGAVQAEWEEYNVGSNDHLSKQVESLEERAVIDSDYRIAVSLQLVNLWKKKYNYSSPDHVVIPCTLNSRNDFPPISSEERNKIRLELGFKKEDIVLVYSGSIAEWQSLASIKAFLEGQIDNNPLLKVLFLSKEERSVNELIALYPERVKRIWQEHEVVYKYLSACDYGLLIREQSITNQVASPTKFAEYLACGLPVIISENLGDYSGFVKEHLCGYVIGNKSNLSLTLSAQNNENKNQIVDLSKNYFSKISPAVCNQYVLLLNQLGTVK